MAYITRITYRHTHAIRHQVISALGMVFKAMRKFDLSEWIGESAPLLAQKLEELSIPDDMYLRHDHTNGPLAQNYAMLLSSAIMNYDNSLKTDWGRDYFIESIRSSSGSDHAQEDYHGTALGGDWDVPNFIVRSGVILLFGALEEFERGALRILCKHAGDPANPVIPSQMFFPRLVDYHQTSDRYRALERSRALQSVFRRHQELNRYGIDADLETECNDIIKLMRNSRNAIAHGEAALVHPFQDFLELNYAIFRATANISKQCEGQLNIAL